MQELNLHGNNFEDIINTKGTFSKLIVKPGKIKKLFPRETTIQCFKLTTSRESKAIWTTRLFMVTNPIYSEVNLKLDPANLHC